MPSLITHPIVAVAIGCCFPPDAVPRRFWIAGAIVACLPDADVAWHGYGIQHASMLAHRGITHSVFAVVVVSVATIGALYGLRRMLPPFDPRLTFLYLLLAMGSHGVLDAMTNGGPGIAFLAPFSAKRVFFPFRPIQVSPLSVSAFFAGRAWAILRSEALWVWLPCAALAPTGLALNRRKSAS